MESIMSLLPSDDPTEVAIPGFEDIDPQPVFLLPPESDPEFAKACLRAKMSTSTATSLKKIPKQHQERAMKFGTRWITGTENCPVEWTDKDGEKKVVELSEVPDWKKQDKIVPKILAVGEKFHLREVVDDEEGNA